MSCDQPQPLDAYVDGELSAAGRADVERHLAGCAPCRAELAALRRLSAALSGFDPGGLPAGALDRLHASVSDAWGAWDAGVLRLARAISAVAAVVVLGGTLYLTLVQAQQVSASAAGAAAWEQVAAGDLSAVDVQLASAGADPQQQVGEWIVSDLNNGQQGR